MSVHIYTTHGQPLTRWRIGTDILPRPSKWFTCSPRRQDRCENCLRLRYASNLTIRVYYDCSRVTCAKPCKPATYKERRALDRKLARKASAHSGTGQ